MIIQIQSCGAKNLERLRAILFTWPPNASRAVVNIDRTDAPEKSGHVEYEARRDFYKRLIQTANPDAF